MAEQIARYVHLRGHLPAKAEEINRALAEIRAVDPVKKYGLVAFET